ncbi:putative nuclear RNA export factor SDE5 isoform X1 [Zingiber officinale]|uniref:putative nuclear RNA export factor SDE5 isoform X1 n=1 Tax=Zingiber officinale TaxID=94328 RepID=UPI001C4BEBB3|nr:putative nuclear RNA export factor SDE5 isoform X1 [Zingiber officinale]XP_042474392.1 putative nuclear RNA export factor SDE5 isoform X1 [Zingiber officinale]
MSALHTSEYDYEMRALQNLFDVFGKVCCLEEIASAYCKAGRDESKAADILARQQGSSSSGESYAQFGKQFLQSVESLDEGRLKNSAYQGKTSCGTKPKKFSASAGSISSVLGKNYVNGVSSSWNRPNVTQKPLKIEIKEPMPCGYYESSVLKSVQTNDFLEDNDVEDFLFSMLGDGFKLSRDVIRNVLGICGYDMKKSMEELLELSSRNLEKGKSVEFDELGKLTGKGLEMENNFCQNSSSNSSSSVRDIPIHSGMEQKNANLPNEVLQSLFNVPERSEEPQKTRTRIGTRIGLNRTRVVKEKSVKEPLEDFYSSSTIDHSNMMHGGLVTQEDDDYEALRRSVKENWGLMKQYYEAAADAFVKGDPAVNYLRVEGNNYAQKAREADEKSAAMLLQPRKSSNKDKVTLDLEPHRSREALDLVKLHLRQLAGIPTFKCLKLVFGADGGDSKKAKTRRLVIKLLNNESIQWNEDAEQGVICIDLDQVNPGKLSFVME